MVKSYHLLGRSKKTPNFVKFLKSLQGIDEHIEKILLLNSFDFYEPDRNFLEVDSCYFATAT